MTASYVDDWAADTPDVVAARWAMAAGLATAAGPTAGGRAVG
ncbi:MAG: hypothetical protein QOI09_1266 [Chloroflexota bacterium]|jgi:hypothetical protein|nr:hypothetical protein [Chloroflexota bacterium]